MGKKHVSNISTHMHVHACTLHARISYASHNVFYAHSSHASTKSCHDHSHNVPESIGSSNRVIGCGSTLENNMLQGGIHLWDMNREFST